LTHVQPFTGLNQLGAYGVIDMGCEAFESQLCAMAEILVKH